MSGKTTKLKSKMIESGYSFEKLSAEINVSPETVFQWADGRRVPPTKILKQIAKVLLCDVKELVG